MDIIKKNTISAAAKEELNKLFQKIELTFLESAYLAGDTIEIQKHIPKSFPRKKPIIIKKQPQTVNFISIEELTKKLKLSRSAITTLSCRPEINCLFCFGINQYGFRCKGIQSENLDLINYLIKKIILKRHSNKKRMSSRKKGNK